MGRCAHGTASVASAGVLASGVRLARWAYLEGWYVDEDVRRQGVGAALVRAAEAWARAKGLTEFASDAQVANRDSQLALVAPGFVEAEWVVAYRKTL